jgi:hypothetical protein
VVLGAQWILIAVFLPIMMRQQDLLAVTQPLSCLAGMVIVVPVVDLAKAGPTVTLGAPFMEQVALEHRAQASQVIIGTCRLGLTEPRVAMVPAAAVVAEQEDVTMVLIHMGRAGVAVEPAASRLLLRERAVQAAEQASVFLLSIQQ